MIPVKLKKSHPPLIILLDVLFIFLFVSILEKPPKISFQLPEEKVFTGGYIAGMDGNGKRRIYDFANGRFLDYFRFSESTHPYFFTHPCGNQIECQNAGKITNDKLSIIITGETYDEIARLTLIGSDIDPKQAADIHFTIDTDGRINMKKLLEDNPFFKEIEGFEKDSSKTDS